MKNHQAVLKSLGLPHDLVELIRERRLLAEVEHAYARLQRLNRQLDEWEQQNPEAATKMPWASARQEWKDAGRPMPEWFEVLQHVDKRQLGEDGAFKNLILWPARWSDPRYREQMRRGNRKKKRVERNSDPAKFGKTVKRELKAAGYVDEAFLAS